MKNKEQSKFWTRINLDNQQLKKELARWNLFISKREHNDSYIILSHQTDKAYMVFKLNRRDKSFITCILFINRSNTKNVELIKEATLIVNSTWPRLSMTVEIETGKINSPSGYCFKLSGWTNRGRNERDNFIYSKP